MLTAEASRRNSELVAGEGERKVQLRSVVSFRIAGRTAAPESILVLYEKRRCLVLAGLDGIRIACSSSPMNMEMIAGGASFTQTVIVAGEATEMRADLIFVNRPLTNGGQKQR